MDFPQKLKELRKKKGYTQEKMSNLLEIGQSAYAKWENGRTQPNIEQLVKIAQILETTTDELLGRHIDFGDTILNKKYKYDLSILKESNEQHLYDFKLTMAFELMDDTITPAILKAKLMEQNKLNKDEEVVLDTLLAEAKEFADDIIAFEEFKKSNRKFKWPWQKERNTNLTPKQSNITKSE